MDVTIAKLREELARLHGSARVPILERLWQEFAVRYWRAGPGTPGALGHLSAAIEALDEAYHLLDGSSPARGEVAGRLGWLMAVRSATPGVGDADREAAMPLLAEALEHSDLSALLATTAHVSLGQLHLDRVMKALHRCQAQGGFLGGALSGSRADGEEAIRHFRGVLDGPSVSAEVSTITRVMLTVAEAVLPLLNGEPDRFDMARLTDATAAMQNLLKNGLPLGMPGSVLSSSLPFTFDLIHGDPLDLPVPDMQGEPGHTSVLPPRRPAPAKRPPTDPKRARRAARDRLAALAGQPVRPVWEQAVAVLQTPADRMAAGALDAYIGAAATAVDAEAEGEQLESGLDRLLSAVGLCLRQRRDGSGWDDDDPGGGGYLGAADLLAGAATRIPPGHPAATAVVEALGGLLGDRRPLSGAITGIAGQLAAYAAEVVSPTAVITALGQLCRTVAAVSVGAPVDPQPLAAAVAAVPAGHAWRPALSTAVGQVRLAAAVRAGDASTVEAAPDGLAPVLDALLRDDVEALRTAVDGLATNSPRRWVAAVLGAGYLELAIRATAPEQGDLDAAIRWLSASTGGLDGAGEGLRTRTWWRLAEAYHRRGNPGDGEASRAAGLEALGCVEPDPRGAARFAGWMLSDGRGAEAYTALESAAAGSGRPEPAAGPLAEDVLDVILGIAPPPADFPRVPACTEVADAVRKVGASALLYLHPTDDAERTAGVLCLDPTTQRLDVLANVPVTDPLTSDDPGWSAIASRWGGGRLLVAASGDLRAMALSAVCTGDRRRLAEDVSVAYVSCGAEVIRLAERAQVPVDRAPLFVVNPRGDRDAEMADVLVLRRLFYPQSHCVGRALEFVDGPGTRQDLLARVPHASLVHLACGLRGMKLDLAAGEALEVGAARGAGLVLLADPGVEGFGPAAEAFLGAGFSGLIGWQWPVPVSFAALALFMTHLMLVDHRLPPAVAVTAVQRWMLDPCRELPPLLPGNHRHTVATVDLTRPALWAALAYHGC